MGNIAISCPKGFDLRQRGCVVTCPENKGYKFVEDGNLYKCVKNGHTVILNPQEPIFHDKNMNVDEFIALEKNRPPNNGKPFPFEKEKERVDKEINNYKEDTSVQELLQKLKPFRPPTAPDSDIERERKAILKESGMSLVAVQVALFSFLLSMLIYLFLPSSYSHILVFLILSVAIALVFFLKK